LNLESRYPFSTGLAPKEKTVKAGTLFILTACSLVGFWANKSDWCWFVVRGKHCWLSDKPWLKPTSEQADNTYAASDFSVHWIRQSCERGARVNNSIKLGVKRFTSHHSTSDAYVVIWTAEEGIPR